MRPSYRACKMSEITSCCSNIVLSDAIKLASHSDRISFTTAFCGSFSMSTREDNCPSKSGASYGKSKSTLDLSFIIVFSSDTDSGREDNVCGNMKIKFCVAIF